MVRAGSCVLRMLMLCIALAGSGGTAAARELHQFSHFGIDSGLPQSQIYALGVDAPGYLWVGTLAGMARYNGREFRHLTTADGLAGNQIEFIAGDSTGHVWAAGTGGLCRLSHADEEVACISAPLTAGSTIAALAVDEQNVWVGTDKGLVRIDSKTLKLEDAGDPGFVVTALHLSARGLWIGTEQGHLILKPSGNAPAEIETYLPGENAVTSILAEDGRVWLGTRDGLWIHHDGVKDSSGTDGEIPASTVTGLVRLNARELLVSTLDGLYRVVHDAAEPRSFSAVRLRGLQNELIRSMIRDREGAVWLGLDNGLARFVPTRFDGFDRRSGLHDDFVRAVTLDQKRRLWLGTRTGLQVVPMDSGHPIFSQAQAVTTEHGLPDDRIYAIETLAGDEALLATNAGLVHWNLLDGLVRVWNKTDGLPSDNVRALRRASDGTLWVATDRGVMKLLDGRLEAPEQSLLRAIYAINLRIDQQGRIWFATVDHGLVILQPDGRVVQVSGNESGDRAVWDLFPAAVGSEMWIGTNGDGLLRVDPRGNIVKRLTTRDGLADDFVWSVLVDGHGDVWAYTTRGLSRLRDGTIVNHDRADGLLHLEGVSTATLEDPDGQLWFGSVGGLMRFRREHQPAVPESPATLIERAEVDGRALQEREILPPDFEDVSFAYATLSFRDETALRYRHRLLGIGDSWSEPAPYRPITYGRLPAGDYRFEVIGRNAVGIWSERPASFQFSVSEPVWRRAWFLMLVGIAIAFVAVLGVRFHARRLRAHAHALELMVRERTEDLEKANLRLLEAATSDPLTGLRNRRFLAEQIQHDIAWQRRLHDDPDADDSAALVFLLIDLDDFKNVNDRYGHQSGDEVLVQVAGILTRQVRQSDYVVRWGGDEFLVVARSGDGDDGMEVAIRIRKALGEAQFRIDDQHSLSGLDCSIGMCRFPFDPDARIDWEQVVEIADVAVYRIKHQGGGRCLEITADKQVAISANEDFVLDLRRNFEDFLNAGLIHVRPDDAI